MSYNSEVLADTPAGYWRLNQTSGTTATDSSGNGRNGSFVGSGYTLGVTGLVYGDSDLAFQSGTGTGRMRTSGSYHDSVNFTAPVIFKRSSGAVYGYVFEKPNRWAVYITDAGAIGLTYYDSSDVDHYPLTADGLVASGTIHHLALKYDGTTWKVLLDGVAVISVADSSASSTGQPIGWGNRNGGASALPGVIDEAAYYTSALSDARIAVHAAAMTVPVVFGVASGLGVSDAQAEASIVAGGGLVLASAIGSGVSDAVVMASVLAGVLGSATGSAMSDALVTASVIPGVGPPAPTGHPAIGGGGAPSRVRRRFR